MKLAQWIAAGLAMGGWDDAMLRESMGSKSSPILMKKRGKSGVAKSRRMAKKNRRKR